MNNNYVTLRGVGGWVRRNVTKRDKVGGWVKNGHFRRDVIMQWPLITLTDCSVFINTLLVSRYMKLINKLRHDPVFHKKKHRMTRFVVEGYFFIPEPANHF